MPGDEQHREQRVEDGRQAFDVMMQGIRQVGISMHALAQSNTALAMKTDQLVGKNNELMGALHASMEHSAALQRQIGALVQILSRMNGLEVSHPAGPPVGPPVAPHLDPVGQFGRRVMNGLLNGAQWQQRERPRGRPPGV